MGNSISLMREKAIASTAVVDEGGIADGEFDLGTRIQRPRSRASGVVCGLGQMGRRVSLHARRVSRGCVY